MRWTYDGDAGACYVHLDADSEIVEQRVTASGIVVDVDSSGRAVGVEIVSPLGSDPVTEIEAVATITPEQRASLDHLIASYVLASLSRLLPRVLRPM
jgi:uncharacterized protein YuzE